MEVERPQCVHMIPREWCSACDPKDFGDAAENALARLRLKECGMLDDPEDNDAE